MIPGQRIVHPEFGDMTADIIEALLEEAKLDDPVILEARQAKIAAASGAMARDLSCGRVIAEFDEDVFQAWEQKEGRDFFTKKGDGVKYLNKHFPSTRVESRSPHVKVHVNRSAPAPVTSAAPRYSYTGRRGRWGCAVPCAA
jgi:hypothetical protein